MNGEIGDKSFKLKNGFFYFEFDCNFGKVVSEESNGDIDQEIFVE